MSNSKFHELVQTHDQPMNQTNKWIIMIKNIVYIFKYQLTVSELNTVNNKLIIRFII